MRTIRKKQENKGLKYRVTSGKSAQDTMLEGSAWLTAASMLSRVLGVVYIIPWIAWMGMHAATANTLYAVGYNIYGIFIQISTAGVPAAISRLVATHNGRNQFQDSWYILKNSMVLMLSAGLFFGILMYVTAPALAAMSPTVNINDSTIVIRSLVPAVMIIPPMSLLRGYFQGFNDMAPSAISQLIEQLLRVAYMLLMTFGIMVVFQGGVQHAVAQSTFAAFVGAVGAIVYLGYRFWVERHDLNELMQESLPLQTHAASAMMIRILKESLPFVLISSGIQIAQLIDQFTFKQLSSTLLHMPLKEVDYQYGIFSFNVNKIIMIIISFAVSMAAASIPLLTSYFSSKDIKESKAIIQQNITLYAFVMFPAAAGMAIVARPIYTLFYSSNPLGSHILVVSCLMSVVLGLYTIVSGMLQATYEHIEAIKGLLIALVIKLFWQPVCIHLFEGAGPVWSTTIGFFAASLYMLHKLHETVPFPIRKTTSSLLRVTFMTVIMSIVASVVLIGGSFLLSPDNKLTAALLVVLVSAAGGVTYLVASLKWRLADEVLGQRADAIRKKLKM